MRNSNSTGVADIQFPYGIAEDIAVVGDWDGDGVDSPGLIKVQERLWLLNNLNAQWWWQIEFQYGVPGDQPLTGDWDGDGIDSQAVGI